MRSLGEWRVMTMAVENITVMSSANPSPTGETVPEIDDETITPTPKMTTAMARAVAGVTRSRSTTHDRSAANSGAAAWISRILATVVCCSATTKDDDAVPKQSSDADPRPAHVAEQLHRAARTVAQQHEGQQEAGRKHRAPEHDGPGIVGRDEAGNGTAEAPGDRRAGDEQDAELEIGGVPSGRKCWCVGHAMSL